METFSLLKTILSSWTSFGFSVVVATSIWMLYLVFYRLYLSPIARFPGPKLAAATGWYECYYDVIKPGMYIFEIEKMHAKYGSIVRVNPTELSIHDADFYDEVYVHGTVRKTNKHMEFCQGTGLDGSSLLTHEHDLHRRRRRVLDPFFSRSAVRKMEPLFFSLLVRFEERIRAAKDTVIRLDHAFVAFSGDMIRSVTCEGIDLLMDDKHWSSSWFELFQDVVKSAPLMTSFPWIIKIIDLIPSDVLICLFPRGKAFLDFKNLLRTHIIQAKQDKAMAREEAAERMGDSIFRKLVNSEIPESELCTERLTKEGQALFGAATVAVARAADCIAYYVYNNPHIRANLAAELSGPMVGYPETFPAFSDLEQLPYLQGVVNEGLRLSYGSMHRMPRVFPDHALQYKQWTIPPNTPVGMSAYLNHTDPTIFPDPFTFNPERWIGENVNPRMKKALTPFTRGSRACLGQNFATSELFMMCAMLFRLNGPDLELYETDESDIISVHDYMIPLPKLDTKGLRVRVH